MPDGEPADVVQTYCGCATGETLYIDNNGRMWSTEIAPKAAATGQTRAKTDGLKIYEGADYACT